MSSASLGPYYRHQSGQITDCQISYHDRPVVVIDPEDTEGIAALIRALVDHAGDPGISAYLADMKYAHAQAALRSLIEPPRPEEPQGLGAVVLHGSVDRYVRVNNRKRPWECEEDGVRLAWEELDAGVTVLSEGWRV